MAPPCSVTGYGLTGPAGIDARLMEAPVMFHAWSLFANLPESDEAVPAIGELVAEAAPPPRHEA